MVESPPAQSIGEPQAAAVPSKTPLLELEGLKQWYPIKRGVMRRTVGHVKAVDGISLKIHESETLGLVGESGCGKTTLIQTLLRLEEPTAGRVLLNVEGKQHDVTAMGSAQLRQIRRHMQLVFQSPSASMNPRMTVFDVVAEPMILNGVRDRAELESRVGELLASVGLNPSQSRRSPAEFSGGQQQRIGIARALALRPKLVIADEPVSALDVSVQSQILNLMNDLKQRHGLTYLFIAHNLNVVKYLSDRIAVMYLGRIVEIGPADEVYHNPKHPYTASLLQAIPITHPDQRDREREIATGDQPDPANAPTGCRFHPRCPHAQERCRTEDPELVQLGIDRASACHFSDELELNGGAS